MLLSRIAVICLLFIFAQEIEGFEEENPIDDNKFNGSSQGILSNQDRSCINKSCDNTAVNPKTIFIMSLLISPVIAK